MPIDKDGHPYIVKKIKKVQGGGHHGGAWKVAYADFVTAMMAFFLLMWLLAASSEEQLAGLADYFSPIGASISSSGSGGVMGGMSMSKEGSMMSTADPVGPTENTPTTQESELDEESEDVAQYTESLKKGEITDEQFEKKLEEIEQKRFAEVETQIKQAIEDMPELQDLANNLIVDRTPEGLRIQIVDQAGTSMFPLGSAKMYDKTYKLLAMVGKVIIKMPNKVSIRGHTDSVQYSSTATYNNWDLSADRANASRRALVDAGINPDKIYNVVGKADTEHLRAEDPMSPQNRRISIVLMSEKKVKEAEKQSETISPFDTEGKDSIGPESYLRNR